MYRHFIKHLCDFFIALFLLITLSPIILLTAILLFLANNGKVFFFQQRPGLNSKPFKIIKFKTMRDAFDKEGIPLPDDLRLTKVGSIVRSASLDELLQLINVLKGDMSLVGPRPLLMHYLPRYSKEQSRRHEVKPGITGWAQINGWRGETDTEEKLVKRIEHDLEYIENWSLLLDLWIVLRTPMSLLKTENAY